MAKTLIDLARQAKARFFTFGSSTAGDDGLVTIEKGTLSTSAVVLDVKASATVAGDLNVLGNLNLTGDINQTNVTNLNVTDKTINLNNGGSTAGASGGGVTVEGDSGAVIGKVEFNNALASKFSVGDGTTQREIVDASSAQTLTNKTLTSPALGGTPTTPTAGAGTNNAQVASTAFVVQEIGSARYLRATTLTGTQDGSNKTFALAQTVLADSEQIFLNGQLLTPGAANDYLLSGIGLTFQAAMSAPIAGDVIRVYGVR